MSTEYPDFTIGSDSQISVEVAGLARWPFPSCNLLVMLGGERLPLREERQTLYSIVGVFESLLAIATNRVHPDATPEVTSRGVRLESSEVLDDVRIYCRSENAGAVVTCCKGRNERFSHVSIETLEEIVNLLNRCFDSMMSEEFVTDDERDRKT